VVPRTGRRMVLRIASYVVNWTERVLVPFPEPITVA
jgi:hypothetical protein